MAQNIYDDPEFFDNYARLPRSQQGLDAAGEWPAIRALLPEMDGLDVVDLGCGYGWFCRWAAEAGAASVLGLDVSTKMLERAAADTDDARVEYRREDLDEVELAARSFDLVYSSLTLHYLVDVSRLFVVIAQALREGGRMVCSVEHPLYTAPSRPAFFQHDGRIVWPLDEYSLEGERITNWLAEGVVKQHRTVATYVNALADAGLAMTRMVEWAPTRADVDAHPDWAIEVHRPPFLLLAAQLS
ncbi:MAG: SAM-dependent methyltransferase [Acidimicrobiales bacterium]|nr:SAM-dependent methyltransferase [Acidimicrobiales bacterium]